MTEEIVLGGGCFWCTEAAFKEVDGVKSVTSGYAGGHTENPSYREVCSGDTGHAEVVKIEYSKEELGLEEILEFFFRIHDPTTEDRQGPDIGSQYRSIILYQNEEEKEVIEAFIEDKQDTYEDEIVTQVKELENFYVAEEKHQDYFEKNPEDAYCRMHASPKVEKAKDFSSKT
ncbi:methionine sulfoxide reductase A [Candidatus Haloredivivus sp. G17]|jgi:peptide-methionine (S)-S-oxide reductase|nr:methionine sulfoxide reductase A [Candidatus Haloredivivus sp. G17]